MTDEETVMRIAARLGETEARPIAQIREMIAARGVHLVEKLVEVAVVVQSVGGLPRQLHPGKMLTLGGVFFQLAIGAFGGEKAYAEAVPTYVPHRKWRKMQRDREKAAAAEARKERAARHEAELAACAAKLAAHAPAKPVSAPAPAKPAPTPPAPPAVTRRRVVEVKLR